MSDKAEPGRNKFNVTLYIMDKTKTIEQLSTLAVGANGRSESARLGDIIDEVEAALTAGVKRQIVLETLHQHYGFKMTMSSFEKALSRFRKAKQAKETESPETDRPKLSTMVTKSTVTETERSRKFISPEDIRKQRKKIMEEAESLESGIYDFNEEEIKK